MPVASWMKELGMVPFAEGRVENGKLINTCPECGKDFRENTDASGEPTTARYAKHFKREHYS